MNERLYRSTKQCKTCPWRKAVDATKLGGDLGHVDRARLEEFCPSGLGSADSANRMSCHRSPDTDPFACVGWLNFAFGVGNNFAVRFDVLAGLFRPSEFTLIGEQHESIESMFDRSAR